MTTARRSRRRRRRPGGRRTATRCRARLAGGLHLPAGLRRRRRRRRRPGGDPHRRAQEELPPGVRRFEAQLSHRRCGRGAARLRHLRPDRDRPASTSTPTGPTRSSTTAATVGRRRRSASSTSVDGALVDLAVAARARASPPSPTTDFHARGGSWTTPRAVLRGAPSTGGFVPGGTATRRSRPTRSTCSTGCSSTATLTRRDRGNAVLGRWRRRGEHPALLNAGR